MSAPDAGQLMAEVTHDCALPDLAGTYVKVHWTCPVCSSRWQWLPAGLGVPEYEWTGILWWRRRRQVGGWSMPGRWWAVQRTSAIVPLRQVTPDATFEGHWAVRS